MRTISRFDAEDIADGIDAELYENYSGRGMFGERCMGFVIGRFENFTEMDLAFAAVETLGLDAARDTFRDMRRDSLGLDTIVYFPGLVLDDLTEDNE